MKAQKKKIIQSLSARISLLLFVVLFPFPNLLFAQSAPAIEWQKCLGGTRYDNANCIINTSDGGYAIVGSTSSSDGDVFGSHLDTTTYRGYATVDLWVVKLSSSGTIEWQKCLGGKSDDAGYSIIQTSDSGFLIAGATNSTDGDVSGLHIDTTINKALQADAWIVKLSFSGAVEWKKCIGGTGREVTYSVIETSDSGYAIAGEACSADGDISVPHHGNFWVMKLGRLGTIEWVSCLGGTNGQELARSIAQTSSGGYIVAGFTYSSNGDVSGFHGGHSDAWVVKLSSLGNLEWQKCLGGLHDDVANSIIRTSDGGYVFAGSTNSNDGDVLGYHNPDTTFRETDTIINGKGNFDAWIVKLDSLGNIEWQSCLGGHGDDVAYSIIQTSDGGFAFTGSTRSTDGDVSGLHGNNDVWLVKLNSSGKLLWQKCIGGIDDDRAASLIQSSDKGYVIAGYTYSKDGDASGIHEIKHGYYQDAWVVKLYATSGVQDNAFLRNSTLALTPYPNPATKIITLGYDLPKVSAVGITIYNITGEQMYQIQGKEENPGHHEIHLDLSGFSAGSYFIKVKTCGLTETIGVEIVR